MSGSDDNGQEPGDATARGPGGESIGAYLSAQRRLRGISVEELSSQTRIPLRSLERLEAGSFDEDVDGFVRGFVRTVAEALGLDPDETLNRTLQEPGGSSQRVSSRLSLPRVLATIAGLGLLVGVGFAVQLVAASLTSEGAADPRRSPIVMRRDPVRSLAEAQGVGALAPAPAVALAGEAAARELLPPVSEVSEPPPEPAPVAGP